MKVNMTPEKVAFIDLEVQSSCDLSNSSTYKYAKHESTRALTCCVKVDGEMRRMGPYLAAEDLEWLRNVATTRTMVAHNAPFDAAIWEHTLGLPEVEWFDTLPCARARGLPGGLDAVGTILTGKGKDKNGKRLIDLLCIIRNDKVPAIGPAHDLLMEYNARDVELLEDIYDEVKGYGEPDVIALDAVINQRGVPIDRGFLMQLLALYDETQARSGEIFAELTGGANPKSPKQVKEWLLTKGLAVDSLNKHATRDLLSRPHDFVADETLFDSDVMEMVREAMEARREVARVGKGKAEAALNGLEDDGRIRGMFIYWGAHTGRWSSRGLQLHNMPSNVSKEIDARTIEPKFDVIKRAAAEATERAGERIYMTDYLNVMLRRLVQVENVLVCDWGAVEARGVAWIFDETSMLESFADIHKSVYLDMGRSIFGREITKKGDPEAYTLSKAVVLGCGYGMSYPKFAAGCKLNGVDLTPLDGLDPVKLYRTTYSRIAKGWKSLHEAMDECVKTGEPQYAGKCWFKMVGKDMHVVLPSGRPLVYRNTRIEPMVPKYCKLFGMPEVAVPTVVYDSPRGYLGFLYGSKMCVTADTNVLTQRGPVPIVDVTPHDLVWDGIEWVEQDGPICNGVKGVVEWQGVRLTPDHTIFDGERWRHATALDARAGGCSLEWARFSAPWKCSNRNPTGDRSRASATGADTDTLSRSGTSWWRKIRRALGAPTSDEERRSGTQRNTRSSTTIVCSTCGGTVTPGCYPDATTRGARRTRGTEAEVCTSAMNGLATSWRSTDTERRSKALATSLSILTGYSTTDITNQGMYGSFRGQSIVATDGTLCMSCSMESCDRLSKSITKRSGTSRRARSTCSSVKADCMVYDLQNCGPRNRYAIVTSGGLAVSHNCENIVQAICRDFLAHALLKVEAAGLNPILHIHDEIVCESHEDGLEELCIIMSTPPTWAPGFPCLVEGYSGPQWTKNSAGYRECHGLMGKIVMTKEAKK